MKNFITLSLVLYNNNPAHLEKLIESINLISCDYILYIIDNSPTNHLNVYFNYKKYIYFHNPSNPGFGASHNIAIKKSLELKSDYHIVINPDIYFDKDSIENIIHFMNANPTIGHVMPKILYPDKTLQYLCKKNPSIFNLFLRGFMPKKLKKYFKKKQDIYEYKNYDYNKVIYDIPYLSGCFMFFRTSILEKVGFFDDKIFMYLEDADITRRFLEISRTAYFPDATIFHHYAGLTHKEWKYKWITIKSAIIYFNKWGWFRNIN